MGRTDTARPVPQRKEIKMAEKTKVVVQLTDVWITVECPHEAVDTETIIDVATTAIRTGTTKIIPRWNGSDQTDGPVFESFVEIIDDPEIQDDDRSEDAPDEFTPECRWWKETQAQNNG